MAHANTSLDCCVRATSTEAQMRDNSVLTLGGRAFFPPRNVLRGRYPTLHRAASLISDFRHTASAVIPREGGIQYAAACRFNHCCLWNAGSPAPVRNCAQAG